MLINQNAVFNAGTHCIVYASDMIMSVLSKNQSAHSSGSHLINFYANSCKFINYSYNLRVDYKFNVGSVGIIHFRLL